MCVCVCVYFKTAEMASRLTALNRWCVTGTPIQKNIDGNVFLFQNYLKFLGLI